MPTHWTYDAFKPDDDLAQGDIIQPTEELRTVLQDAHRHFLDPKYTAFIVLTQSCDIVRRNDGACKSRYINLAVIRPLEDVLLAFLDTECDGVKIGGSFIEGLYVEESKYRAEQLLSRILNQNEHGLGLFYVHADADIGIAVPSVALLQVSIALRRDSYRILMKARTGRLTAEFQSRLGWIIGNLYSRVATRDWNAKDRTAVIGPILAPSTQTERGPLWIPRASMNAANEKGVRFKDVKLPDVVAQLQLHKPRPPMDIAIERCRAIVHEIATTIPDGTLELLCNRLHNDQTFESTFK